MKFLNMLNKKIAFCGCSWVSHYKDNNKLYHEKLYENNNNEDLDEGLPEFPDLVRGRQKENILRKNLKINPKGPKPDDYRSS